MKDQFTPIMRRTRRWKFEGGTTELMLGGSFLSASLYFLLQLVPGIPPAGVIAAFAFGLVVSFLLPAGLQRRHVIPRSGYVVYKEATRRGAWRPLLLGAGAGLAMAVLLYLAMAFDNEHAFAWMTSIMGVFIGLVWLIANLNFRLRRLTALALLSILLGLSVSPPVLGAQATRGSDIGGILLGGYFLAMAVAFLLSGGLTLRAYLRDTPLPGEAPDVR